MTAATFVHDFEPQSFYEAYNTFIYSKDRKVFGKLASKLFFCELTRSVPGDVVELGVFKGSGIMAWLKANALTSVNQKKVYGFDIFDVKELVPTINSADSAHMSNLFSQRDFDPAGFDSKLYKIAESAGFDNLNLVVGNVLNTVPKFLAENPGFRASIVNFDLDLCDPTAVCLEYFWDRVVPGGVLIFDEYAVSEWTESDAVDRFVRDRGLKLQSTPYHAPTAFLVK